MVVCCTTMQLSRNGCGIPKWVWAMSVLLTLCFVIWRILIPLEKFHVTHSVRMTQSRLDESLITFPTSQWMPGIKLYVHRAYLDMRFRQSVIRVFAFEHRLGSGLTFNCKWTVVDAKSGKRTTHTTSAKRYKMM